jgi:hypothetical protein
MMSLAWVAVIAQGPSTYSVRASDGTVTCLVAQARDGSQGERQLAVQARAPSRPTAEALATLPAELRDFSSVPIRVVLLSAPGGSTPLQRMPVSLDPTLEHPTIDGSPSGDGFVRAVFPRAWVVGGTTILAERMVVAPSGTRVTSQTRCAITEADAAHWR